jgi:N-hydroxyarylamine O-acetyltransferase
MDVTAYLSRIDHTGPVKPDVQTLHELQQAHLLAVPFENLDIGWKRLIRLDLESLWEKIIVQRRGGFCYELNGLFAHLLKSIGYDVTYLNARVFNSNGEPGINFDHLALLIQSPDAPIRWLADVGFGDSFHRPLNLDERAEQMQGLRAYRLEETPAGYISWQRNYDGIWERQYFFDLQPHKFPEEYESACLYHQTSPRSSFTRGAIISRATRDGRITLEERRLIITKDGQRSEQPVRDQAEYHQLLKQHFGVTLPKEQT